MWAIVPVKRFDQAKSRLATVLSTQERIDLCLAMTEDVVDCLTKVSSIQGIAIISSEPLLKDLLIKYACIRLEDQEGAGFSANMDHAANWLEARGHTEMIYVPADVPAITPDEIETLIRNHNNGVTIVPAKAESGTNLLVCTPPSAIPFQFGPNSCDHHHQVAQSRGLPVQILQSPGLANDIDEPDDLYWLMKSGIHCRTTTYLQNLTLEIIEA